MLWSFVKVGQRYREVTVEGCIVFVADLDADGIGRGVAFVIEGGGGLERTVLIERKEGIVPVPTEQV